MLIHEPASFRDTSEAMKTDPKYGHYPWWPENGNDWVHPEDVELARSLIPSERVFRRDGEQGPYVVLHYGDLNLRVKRTLWMEVESEGFEVGDFVEVLSRGNLNTPRTCVIRDVLWDDHERGLRYLVAEGDVPIPNRYAADDLRHAERPRLD